MSVLELTEFENNSGGVVDNCLWLTRLELPSLIYSSNSIIIGNSKLASICAPNLETIYTYSATMFSKFFGEYAEFPKIKVMYGGLFGDAPNLKNNPCPNLEIYNSGTYGASLGIFWGNCNIPVLSLPYLTSVHSASVTGGLLISGDIEELYLPSLTRITSNYSSIYDGALLQKDFPNLRKLVLGNMSYSAYILCTATYQGEGEYRANVPKLIHLEFASLDVGCNLSRWTLSEEGYSENYRTLVEDSTICDNNYEQFLYNFKTYIIDRLIRNNSKRNLTLPSALYNVVAQATLTKFTEGEPYNEWLDNKLVNVVNWGLLYV